jgi:superfamily II DNA/RNA helicase
MSRREDSEAQMRRFMDPHHNLKPARFADADFNKPWSDEMNAIARKINEKWGTEPRKWQGQAMDCVVQGRDVMVRAGTGAGKSMCFQALALLRPGATVLVVSPLVGLMENQVIPSFWYVPDTSRHWICSISKSQQFRLQRTTLKSILAYGNELRPVNFRWFMRLRKFYWNIAALSFSTL